MPTKELRDWRGELIGVGTRVVYPVRHGSALWTVEALVVEVTEEENWRGDKAPILRAKRLRTSGFGHGTEVEPKVVKLRELDRVTVVL